MGNEASSASTTNGTICGGNAASLEDTTMLDYGLEEAAGEADTPVDSDHYATPYMKKYPYSAGAPSGFQDHDAPNNNNHGPDDDGDSDSYNGIAGEERWKAESNRGDRRRPRKMSISHSQDDIDLPRHESRPEKGMGRRKRSLSADLTSYGHGRSGRLEHGDSDWDDFRIGGDDGDGDGRLPAMAPLRDSNGNEAMTPADLAAMWRSRNAQSERRPGPLYFWGRAPLQRRMSEPIVSYTPSPSPPPPGDTPMAVEEVYEAQPDANEVFKRCDRVMMFDDSGLL